MGFSDPGEEYVVYVFERLGGTFSFRFSPPSFTYSPGKVECASRAGPFSATFLYSVGGWSRDPSIEWTCPRARRGALRSLDVVGRAAERRIG